MFKKCHDKLVEIFYEEIFFMQIFNIMSKIFSLLLPTFFKYHKNAMKLE
jgi:hypothetical protein